MVVGFVGFCGWYGDGRDRCSLEKALDGFGAESIFVMIALLAFFFVPFSFVFRAQFGCVFFWLGTMRSRALFGKPKYDLLRLEKAILFGHDTHAHAPRKLIHTEPRNRKKKKNTNTNPFPPSRPTMTQQRSILKTPLVLLVLMSATVSQAVVSPDACMQNGFVLPDVPECTFGALSEAFARVFQEAQDIGMACPHDATTELQYLLGATDADDADAILKETVCQPGFDNYENKLPFEVIAGKGTDFDENYYQGGATFNEQRATLYNRYDEQVDDELYLLKEDAAHIDSFYDAQGRYGMVEFPSDHVSSLSTCEHNAMYCCWPQDRQANDNNGNCDDPYDTDCVDSDPADNTDLCYAKTAEGFLAFPGEDGNNENNAERSIHCHGTAWANPETADTSWAFRGNNLFYISMYDHLYQRGYVRNIEGHPMCGCIEDVSRIGLVRVGQQEP